jgi:hypothetical protein
MHIIRDRRQILRRVLHAIRCSVNALTGFFTFKMKVNDEPRQAVIEIRPPGISSEKVVHVVRGEWANLVAPSVSQNRIECLGWNRLDASPNGWKPTKTIGPNPVIIWRPADDQF